MTEELRKLAHECKANAFGDITIPCDVVLGLLDSLDAALAEVQNLHTVMMAAAVEITEHWDAHCDAEGYGPVNLVRRLENGYPEQYGYDAQTVVRMEKERDEARAEVERLTQDRDEWKESTIAANQNAANEEKRRRDMQEERDILQARLAEIEKRMALHMLSGLHMIGMSGQEAEDLRAGINLGE